MFRSSIKVPVLLITILALSFQGVAEETVRPSLKVAPVTALVDEPVSIEVTGCEPGQTVVLRAVCFDGKGLRWESRAVFEADPSGRVDPATMPPKYGSYGIVDPMGLFWSMTNDEGPDSRIRFEAKPLDPITVVIQLEIAGDVIQTQRLVRQQILPSVTRREVRERGLVGTLFTPETKSPVGAILVLGGSNGGLNEGTAALLASHGYVTLALAYFGIDPLPEDLVEIPLEYFETAIRFLGEQDLADIDRIAVLGKSYGGELVLLLGATFPQVHGVVAYVPSGLVWGACCSKKVSGKPSWTYEGKPIIPLRFDRTDSVAFKTDDERLNAQFKKGEPLTFTPTFQLKIENAINPETATIPVEKIQGAILLISGKADALWPSTELADIAVRRLQKYNFPFWFKHYSYKDAGHMISYPFLPTTISALKHNKVPVVLQLGGTPAGNAHASLDSWRRVLDFFEMIFDQKEN